MRLIGLALTFVLALSLAAAAQLALALPASAQIPDFPPPKPIVDFCKVLIGGDFWTEASCRDYMVRMASAPDHLGWSITATISVPGATTPRFFAVQAAPLSFRVINHPGKAQG